MLKTAKSKRSIKQKYMKKCTLMVLGAVLLGKVLNGQTVSLPYFTGFDNTTQKAGWVEYKKGGTLTGGWDYTTTNYGVYSMPQSLWQIYSTSENVDNWFVSPAFLIPAGGKVDSVRYMFNGMSVPDPADTVAIYLLKGSADPALAAKTLLFDIRGTDYVNDNTYRKKVNMALAATNATCRLAIRFKCTAGTWLQTYFDNIAISANTATGVKEIDLTSGGISLYPNPAKETLVVTAPAAFVKQTFQVISSNGALLKEFEAEQHTSINISQLAPGTYFICPKNKPGLSQKFVKE